MDNLYIGVYWGDREETLHQAVFRTESCLKQLSNYSCLFEQWFKKGANKTEAIKTNIKISSSEIKNLIASISETRDLDARLPILGSSFSLWSGNFNQATEINLCFGLHANRKGLLNRCIIRFSEEISLDLSTLEQILKILIDSWIPDWGVVTSTKFQRLLNSPPRTPKIGWITYLSGWRGHSVDPSLPSFKKNLENQGTLYVLTTEHVDSDNDEHVFLAKKLKETLEKAMLLQPSPQFQPL